MCIDAEHVIFWRTPQNKFELKRPGRFTRKSRFVIVGILNYDTFVWQMMGSGSDI